MTVGTSFSSSLFKSFFQGGFECSTQRLRSGKRLDIIAGTQHDFYAQNDYRQLATYGIRTVRDGVRWHIIESNPNSYDFSSLTPMIEAARRTSTQVIWDLLHYGYPDDLDIWSPAFVTRFARFAKKVAQHLKEHTDDAPFWCPINEISFFSWGAGDVGYLNPFAVGRGFELKVQLARASIAAMIELRAVDSRARFVQCEPVVAVHHEPALPHSKETVEGFHEAQFQAFDLLTGRIWPQIGGDESFLDIIGLNYYSQNQWIFGGTKIDAEHFLYRPFHSLLEENYTRYQRPLSVSETGIEGDARAAWFTDIVREIDSARQKGIPVEGVCLYPIANHLGWDDDRLCPNGLLSHDVHNGRRGVHQPLADILLNLNNDFAQIAPDMSVLNKRLQQREPRPAYR
jgi:polysaccharide biosynthesis protein PelF